MAIRNSNRRRDRYLDNLFKRISVTTVEYGGFDQDGRPLQMDIYSPVSDETVARSCVIFLPGGGFKRTDRTSSHVKKICKGLARKGYVTIAMDYSTIRNSEESAAIIHTVISAVRDLNCAITYVKSNSEDLRIDQKKIFISGASAGAIAALTKVFIKSDRISEMYGIRLPDDLFGANQVPGDTTVAGVFSLWGAIFEIEWITRDDIPVGCVHSIHDKIVPWTMATLQKSGIILYGSYLIHERATGQGLYSVLHGFDSHGHNFGLKSRSARKKILTMMTEFFYRVMQQTPDEPTGSIPELE